MSSFQAALDGGTMVDVTSLLNGVGFTLTAADLATINGGTPLADGPHTLSLQATDSLGHASAAIVAVVHARRARGRCRRRTCT